jgi:DNA-binding NtrC family response regulator
MFAGAGLTIVTGDAGFADMLQLQLQAALRRPAQVCSFEAVRQQVETGALLLVAASASDARIIRQLAHELALHHRTWQVLVVETPDVSRQEDLAYLDPYLVGRFAWPDEAAALVGRIAKIVADDGGGGSAEQECPEALISRRLQSQTPSLVPQAKALALAAAHDVTVLLTGETGTGKTFLARMIHACSPRRAHGFLIVPCGALAANLIESEFFGHVKGSFTGADRTKVGKFQAAGKGTLLLDEIDTLALEQQVNLLRVLETGEYESVGSNETQVCQARIIVASNLDLEEAIKQGKFRQDLYYRLNVMSFHLPPLRERVQDIARLARGMAVRFASKFGKQAFDIHADALKTLESFSWPGNIRQLENVIQQAVLVGSGPMILPQHLPPHLRESMPPVPAPGPEPSSFLIQHREARERTIIERAIVNHDFSRERTARALGISRVTLYKKMRKYGLLEMPRSGRGARTAAPLPLAASGNADY